jgi:hypothetical protein
MICPVCFTKHDENLNFCTVCGACLVSGDSEPEPESPSYADPAFPETVPPTPVFSVSPAFPEPAAAASSVSPFPASPGFPDQPSPAPVFSASPAFPESAQYGAGQYPPQSAYPVYANSAQLGATNTGDPDKNWASVSSMVCGISAIPLILLPFAGIFLAIAAIIFSIIGFKSRRRGMAIAGIICGSIGMLISIIVIAIYYYYYSLTAI